MLHPVNLDQLIPNKLIIEKGNGMLPKINIEFCKANLERSQAHYLIGKRNKLYKTFKNYWNFVGSSHYNSYSKRNEETLTHCRRIDMIYLSQVHKFSLRKTAQLTNSHYSSVRAVIEAYKATGRTNKLLTYQSKQYILEQRHEH